MYLNKSFLFIFLILPLYGMQKEETLSDCFSQLPKEIQIKIIEYISFSELKPLPVIAVKCIRSLMCINKLCARLVNSPHFIKSFKEQLFRSYEKPQDRITVLASLGIARATDVLKVYLKQPEVLPTAQNILIEQVKDKNYQAVLSLLKAGVDSNTREEKNELTINPLVLSSKAHLGTQRMFNLLTSPTYRETQLLTVLMLAVKTTVAALVDLLLRFNAHPLLVDKSNITARQHAESIVLELSSSMSKEETNRLKQEQELISIIKLLKQKEALY